MVREVGVHDDDKGAGGELEAVDVGGTEAQLACPGFQDYVGGSVEGLKLLRDFERAVGGAVVDDYDFPV